MEPIGQLLSPDFMPHGYCYLWDPRIFWLHVVSDGLITLSYYAIPVALLYLVRKRRDLPFHWPFWMFGLFIMSCGTAHLMEVWNVWHASYLASGVIKAITAVGSVATAVALVVLIPKALALPSPEQFRAVNVELQSQIAERDCAYAELSIQKSTAAEVRRAQEALRDSQAQISAIVQSAMDAIITLNSDQRIVLFNATAEKMFGCSACDAVGQSIERFIPQRFRAAHANHVQRFGEAGATNRTMGMRGALSGLRANGEEFPIEASISHVSVGGQKLFTAILRDISERRQAEERNARLAAIVDSSDDAIISKTLQGMITAWNRGAEKVFGYSSSEAVGKTMLMLLPPERANEEADILARIGRGESVEHFETIRMRKDGTAIDVSVTISPIRDSHGAIVGASKIARDITERKRVQDALRQSNERRKFALETAKLGDWELDLTTLQATRSLLHDQIFGYSSLLPEWSFDIFLRHVHPDDRERIRENFQGCVSQGKRWEFECRIVWPNGDIRWIWACGDHYRDRSCDATGMFGIVQDITARKRAEEALREQAQMLDSAQVFGRDLESRVVFWPRGAQKLYGFTSHEALGVLSHDLFHTQFPEPLDAIEKKLFETGMWEGELIHTRRDGSIITVASTWTLERNREGHPVRILEANTDITARKQAEEEIAAQAEELSRQADELARSRQALEEQTLMLRSVLDSMAEGLVTADEQGKFVIWNPAAERILGHGATELSSQEWPEHYKLFLADKVTPFPTDQLPMVRAIRGEVSTSEMFVRNPAVAEGTWIEASGGPLRDRDGTVRGGVVAFRDITERKASEREIHRLNDELEQRVIERTAQLQAAKDELEGFTYSVSHDLRAPLRHIAGFIGILMEDCAPQLDAEARRHLERIQEGTRRMGTLVDELLALARVGRQAVSWQPTRLNTLVEDAVTLLKPDTEGRQVEWKIADLPQVDCDPTLMRQVFQNLISNALKYSRTRTSALIEIGHLEENLQSTIFVRDNGVGFSMKYADKLFGVFQRLHRAEEFEGTGVGLATVQRIVQKHGGRAWGEGEIDKGATFYFTLGSAHDQIKTKTTSAGENL